MSQKSFCLVDEPFIPVASRSERCSLRQIFTDECLSELALDPWLFIPVFRLLLCIGQAACTPKTREAVNDLSLEAFREQVLEYLDKHRAAFDLYGEHPFLQVKELAGKSDKLKPLEAYTPYAAYGNNLVLKDRGLLKDGRQLSDADAALLLIAASMHSSGGKRVNNDICLSKCVVKGASGRISPFLRKNGCLHSFYLGNSILQSVWLNLLSDEDIAGSSGGLLTLGRPCWELNVNSEDCPDAMAMRNTYLGRLVPLVRYFLLHDGGQVICTDGVSHCDLSDSAFDFSMTVRDGKKGLEVLGVSTQRRPWRDFLAFMSFLDINKVDGDWHCEQLRCCFGKALSSGLLRVWCGGAAVKTTNGEQKISGSCDLISSIFTLADTTLVSSGDQAFVDYKRCMEKVENYEKVLYACAMDYYKDLSDPGDGDSKKAKSSKPKNIPPQIDIGKHYYWTQLDQIQAEIFDFCFAEHEPDEYQALEQQLFSKFRKAVLMAYSSICPSSTARTLIAYQKHLPFSSKRSADKKTSTKGVK